jgi:uncharacterized membrane protein
VIPFNLKLIITVSKIIGVGYFSVENEVYLAIVWLTTGKFTELLLDEMEEVHLQLINSLVYDSSSQAALDVSVFKMSQVGILE